MSRRLPIGQSEDLLDDAEWADAKWLPVCTTLNGRVYHGNYAISDRSIIVVRGGRHVSTWVAAHTMVRTLAALLLEELVRAG